jgi:hypothetical protein
VWPCAGLMASGSLLPHHSLEGAYNTKAHDEEISGSVETMKFANAHGWLTRNVSSFSRGARHSSRIERTNPSA